MADGQPAALPFWLLSLPSAPRQQLQAAATYFKRTIKAAPTPLPAPPLTDKIRIAYVSVDFCAHATSHLVAGLFEAHDRAKFEVIALAVGSNAFDPMRQQIAKAVDRLIDCAERSDAEVADLSRQQGLHIALDLNVYTARQPGIFARRIAPVQVNISVTRAPPPRHATTILSAILCSPRSCTGQTLANTSSSFRTAISRMRLPVTAR